MNKTVVLVVIILVILLFGLGGFYFWSRSSSPAVPQNAVTAPVVAPPVSLPTPATTLQGTLRTLLGQTQPVTCTYSTQTGGAAVNGTVYVSGGKMRGDFTSTSTQANITGHVIVDSGYSYIWMDAAAQGFKFPVNASPQPAASGASSQPGGVDLNQAISYTCQNWTAEAALFTLPAGVTFSSLKLPSISSQPSASAGAQPSSQCAACDNLPAGPGRDACRTQLHCQ
jgi:hypothetical protein